MSQPQRVQARRSAGSSRAPVTRVVPPDAVVLEAATALRFRDVDVAAIELGRSSSVRPMLLRHETGEAEFRAVDAGSRRTSATLPGSMSSGRTRRAGRRSVGDAGASSPTRSIGTLGDRRRRRGFRTRSSRGHLEPAASDHARDVDQAPAHGGRRQPEGLRAIRRRDDAAVHDGDASPGRAALSNGDVRHRLGSPEADQRQSRHVRQQTSGGEHRDPGALLPRVGAAGDDVDARDGASPSARLRRAVRPGACSARQPGLVEREGARAGARRVRPLADSGCRVWWPCAHHPEGV